MRALLLFPFLLLFVPTAQQDGSNSGETSPAVILAFKYDRSRQFVETPDSTANTPPTRDPIPTNKVTGRPLRGQPTGVKDPNDETLDGRRAAIEKDMQVTDPFHAKAVDGFQYRAKIQNASGKLIQVVFWEYQFTETANPSNVVRRQFLCSVNLKPDKNQELQVFSTSGPSDVISVGSLSNKSGKLFQEKVVINRVEYADGSIWQRRNWNFGEVRNSLARAIATPWKSEMCRGL